MLKTILIISVVTILIMIALLHFYWALGGKWGVESAIPGDFRTTYFNEKNEFKVQVMTIIVAIGLIVFATIIGFQYLIEIGQLEDKYHTYVSWVIAAIFIIRAIGDFNYVGIFKKSSDDGFAKNDTRIYIPICLFIGISTIVITAL